MLVGMSSKAALKEHIETLRGIDRLLAVVAQLRHPAEGCPWDLKQTHTSLKPYMLEEAYEAVEAMGAERPELLKEELGDVLLQVALHAQLAKDAGQFDFQAVSEAIADKLIRRHPHVFGDTEVTSADEVTQNWQAIKAAERGKQEQSKSILDGVSRQQPALSRALETSKRAVKVGFEWPSLESLWECVMSEYDEFREADRSGADPAELEEEMGDILFATVNLARQFKIDPETALTVATAKFTRRFQAMEQLIRERYDDRPLSEVQGELDFKTWDALWQEAKILTRQHPMPE